jgi:Protein of unknown function (DUF2778)
VEGRCRWHEPTTLGRDGGALVHVDMRLISAAIAAPAVGFAFGLLGTLAVGPAKAELRDVLARISVLGTNQPKGFDVGRPSGSQMADHSGERVVASLEPEFAFQSAAEASDPARSTTPRASFGEPVLFGQRLISFDDRFTGDSPPDSPPANTAQAQEPTNDILPPPPEPQGNARPAAGRSAPRLASLAPAGAAKTLLRTTNASKDWNSLPEAGSKTAIYDIVARTVYLPNGQRLEAHSGLGSQMDDPRYINAKGRGPTPPNVYDLTLREELFHGVRAIRLNPVDDGKMFGRDGMLAHTYMLGPNGQSNGCVSFNDYPAFLNAYLRGEIDRLVVVEHLANGPGPDTASGWLPEAIANLFRRS